MNSFFFFLDCCLGQIAYSNFSHSKPKKREKGKGVMGWLSYQSMEGKVINTVA